MHALFLAPYRFQFLFEFDVRQGPTWTAPRAGDDFSQAQEGGEGGIGARAPLREYINFSSNLSNSTRREGPPPSPPLYAYLGQEEPRRRSR